MNGEEFYKKFRNEFDPNHNSNVKAVYAQDRELRPSEWTDLMSNVLLEVMRKAGFDSSTHLQEVPLRKGKNRGLVDHKWQAQNQTVFIEHENNIRPSVESEIRNLLNSDGDLRILITYSTDSSKRDSLRESLYKQLKESKSSRKFEFLLIIGTDSSMKSYKSWEAFHYRPSFEEIPLGSES